MLKQMKKQWYLKIKYKTWTYAIIMKYIYQREDLGRGKWRKINWLIINSVFVKQIIFSCSI